MLDVIAVFPGIYLNNLLNPSLTQVKTDWWPVRSGDNKYFKIPNYSSN